MASGISAHRFPEPLRALGPESFGDGNDESLRDASDRERAGGDGRSFCKCSGEKSGNRQALAFLHIGATRRSA